MANLLLAIIYLAFISLGLPDPLLGAAWPSMAPDLGASLSWAGVIAMIISAGTIVSSLLSDRLTLRLGTGKVTAWSVCLTMIALFGFSIAPAYWALLLFAIPYGLGAGGVDAALNNYVALHYASRHMSWLHAMWGLGTLIGPNILSFALARHVGWRWGYRSISLIQLVLTLILFASLPLWQSRPAPSGSGARGGRRSHPLSYRQVLAIPGAPEILFTLFCYCSLESTAMLWGSSYMHGEIGINATRAAAWAALFTAGITVGRVINGFATLRLSDRTLIRVGECLIAAALFTLLLPLARPATTVAGFLLLGLGCGPIYPSVIHSTPALFGAERSQAVIGMQMAFAYTGGLLMPPLFGLIAQKTSLLLLPAFLLALLVAMVVLFERLQAERAKGAVR